VSNIDMSLSSGTTTITLEEYKRYRQEQDEKHIVQPVPRVRNWDE
jgi:hypothetical protein